MVDPLMPAIEFFLGLWNALPLPIQAVASLYFALFFVFSLFSLIYKIRS